jgi:hypothetical protein
LTEVDYQRPPSTSKRSITTGATSPI